MACVYLGCLSVREIEKRYEFEFTDSERERLNELWHQTAEFKSGDTGWHMFDIPEFLAISRGPVGDEVLSIFMRHNNEIVGCLNAGYANDGEASDI